MKINGTITGILYNKNEVAVKIEILRDDGGLSILSVTEKIGKQIKINERINILIGK